MSRIRRFFTALLALVPLALVLTAAAHAEKRIALVIGNAGYQAGALNTPANDAGLIAQTLQAAGFDVVGARDLDQDSLRRAFRDFLEKATGSGPDTVAFVYLSGYGLQLEGENYFVPIDAKIARDSDVPLGSAAHFRLHAAAGRAEAQGEHRRARRRARQSVRASPVRRWPAAWRWSSRSPAC